MASPSDPNTIQMVGSARATGPMCFRADASPVAVRKGSIPHLDPADRSEGSGTNRTAARQRSALSPLQQSQEAFDRELPALLRDHVNEWVAYHGGRRLGSFATKNEAVRAGLEQRVPRGEIYVRCIEPETVDRLGLAEMI